MLKRRFVGRGMHLEFHYPEYRTPIVTSPFRKSGSARSGAGRRLARLCSSGTVGTVLKQKTGALESRCCAALRVLQFLPRSFEPQNHTRDGSWFNRPRLEPH